MGKRGTSGKKDGNNRSSKRRARHQDVNPEDMDDEIDVFHKQRDVVPLNIHSDSGESIDVDDEEPILNLEADEEDTDEEDDDDTQLKGFAAKIARTEKYVRQRMGGAEDEMDEEEETEREAIWGGYNADVATSSDEEALADEEKEVLRMQNEKAKALSMEDYGLEDISEDESDREPTLGEIAVEGRKKPDAPAKKDIEDNEEAEFQEVKKDLNALSKEEQMDVVYSSAPELVGLLSELNATVDELDARVNPLLIKVKAGENMSAEGVRYLEVKQILLLSYCQAITFYLLLKSEGQSVRDHPVIGRLVEIKNLLDKMKELDANLPSDIEEILDNINAMGGPVPGVNQEENAVKSEALRSESDLPSAINESQATPHLLEDSRDGKKQRAEKPQDEKIGAQSMEMLKVRASLEEKLRKKGILSSAATKAEKNKKPLKPVNGMLETREDFDDDATANDGSKNSGNASLSLSNKLSGHLFAGHTKKKVISGDDDLPRIDGIGERRRKYELRVLAGAGIEREDEAGIEDIPPSADLGSDSSESKESADELYEEVKQQRAAKLAAKAEKYSRTSAAPALPETVDGKRLISYQMEKNRGLTRPRKKLLKNPRKKYRTKHQNAVVRRKGQVRDVRTPSGPYGGEASGINAAISRSIRFKG